ATRAVAESEEVSSCRMLAERTARRIVPPDRDSPRDAPGRAEGAPARPSRRWAAPRVGHRARSRPEVRGAAYHGPAGAGRVVSRERGVVGFDIAGEEAGHPPKAHIEAFQLCRRENFSITIHAGEAFGPPSIWQALQYCGAHRIGHGVRLVEDMAISEGKVVKLGPLAEYVRDKRIPLEL